jgi:hypothetical protein
MEARMDRQTWEYDSSDKGSMWEDEQIEVTITPTHVLIVVIEEHAMDSYNETLRNAIKVPLEKARELASFLAQGIPTPSGAETTGSVHG